MALILIFALAYAIQGAISQGWSDGKAAVKARVSQARSGGGRTAVALGFAAWLGGVLAGIGRSVGAGWVKGWRRGKQRGQDYRDRVAQKRSDAQKVCTDCGHGSVKVPSRRDCPCAAEGCWCTNAAAPTPPAPTGGAAVGECATCTHPYRAGRVANCKCANPRCPCHIVGVQPHSPTPASSATT